MISRRADGGKICRGLFSRSQAMLRIQADVMEMRGSVMELEKEIDLDPDESIGKAVPLLI